MDTEPTLTDSTVDDIPAGDSAADGVAVEGGGDLVEEELLVEEISIDGMCGVY